jgi:hypothetical protein
MEQARGQCTPSNQASGLLNKHLSTHSLKMGTHLAMRRSSEMARVVSSIAHQARRLLMLVIMMFASTDGCITQCL